jgi:hypothetical protein
MPLRALSLEDIESLSVGAWLRGTACTSGEGLAHKFIAVS